MGVFEEKIAAAEDMGFRGKPDFVTLRAAGHIAFGNGASH
jgi:hypothetical protein